MGLYLARALYYHAMDGVHIYIYILEPEGS